MHTVKTGEKIHTQDKQTNTQKMKHAPVKSRGRTAFQNLHSGDRF